ncbi:hypothetical protein F7734_24890 [Scytonema sp. UIC 10036]|uniref:hypothetical protein n=1 Tax=Scytonema sp. UIC 10036 TaxID=2304196 RepID=UPI0012DA167D|nr:hypothetical protein [Scytonema sp. UIC 10036]MUG95422.1 hypothetical protein [Scytonema sp. UIC 10036]
MNGEPKFSRNNVIRSIFLLVSMFLAFDYWLTHRPVDSSLPKEEKFIQAVKISVSHVLFLIDSNYYLNNSEQQRLSLKQGKQFCQAKEQWQNEILYKDRAIKLAKEFTNVYWEKWGYDLDKGGTIVGATWENAFRYLCPELNSSN